MIQITAQIENALAEIAGDQLPFATSLALNRTANGARDVVRENLPKRFRLNRTSLPKSVKSVMSRKTNLVAMVTAPGFLGIHETGGTMTPTSSTMLAARADGVKTRALRNREGTFRKDMGNGHEAIFKRKGKSIKLLAWLSKQHEFDERLHMADDVQEHVNAAFGANFRAALGQALATR